MKKFTFMLIATFFAVCGFAQKPFAKAEKFVKDVHPVQNIEIKKAPRSLPSASRMKAQKKAAED